jgi:hypothetical protein
LRARSEEKQKVFDEGKKVLDAAQDEVKFLRSLMPKRPRTEANDPFKQPAYLKRFLCYHDWSRAELSTLSCVSKSWRKHCQGILFGASAAVFRPTSLIRCSAAQVHLPRRQARLRRVSCMPVLQSFLIFGRMTAYLQKKTHLAEICTAIDLSFKSHYGQVTSGGIAEFIPV